MFKLEVVVVLEKMVVSQSVIHYTSVTSHSPRAS